MHGIVLLALLGTCCHAKQPGTPDPAHGPDAAPLRDLEFGQVNFLHTTDTHGWHAGHLLEASYSADWGDYIDFSTRLREKLEAEGKDLLVVDTGDRIEGNGLYDASEPKGKYTFEIFSRQHINLICSGNHELYKRNSSENEVNITVPNFREGYLASNLDVLDAGKGEFVPLAQRFRKFRTRVLGVRVTAFGFLYNFGGNNNYTRVRLVQDVVKEKWFQEVVRERDVDLFVVIGHAGVTSQEFEVVYQAIREVQWDAPIQFLGGHFHIRDYKKFDDKAYGLASGRFMETIGFQSIDRLSLKDDEEQAVASPRFFRRYIDNNLRSLYHHSGHNASTFHSDLGRSVSKQITKSRQALNLDHVFGCAPKDLWMSRAEYPSDDSIFTWLEQRVLPEAVNDTARADQARLILLNTGAIRFDIFQGAFTTDSTFIVSPFTSGMRYIPDVPYEQAMQVIKILNSGGEVLVQGSALRTEDLAPPEQRSGRQDLDASASSILSQGNDQRVLADKTLLTPGYTTVDDAGTDGDDTPHSPIAFYRVPNCIQSIVNPKDIDLDHEDARIDFVFNEFLEPYLILALKFLGLSYTDSDVLQYLPEENFTTLLAKWISDNWKGECQ